MSKYGNRVHQSQSANSLLPQGDHSTEDFVLFPAGTGDGMHGELRAQWDVVDCPILVRAYNLKKGDSICVAMLRARDDCAPNLITEVMLCGKQLCLDCDQNVIVLAIPGRYAFYRPKPAKDFVYIEREFVSEDMARLAIEQLRCCCT